MSETIAQPRRHYPSKRILSGAGLIVVASLVGLIVSIVNYFEPHGPIAQSLGALLVLVSTALLLLAALWIAFGEPARWLAVLLDVLIVLDVLGTGFCAYFLEAPGLLVLMVVALVGWIWHLARRSQRGYAR